MTDRLLNRQIFETEVHMIYQTNLISPWGRKVNLLCTLLFQKLVNLEVCQSCLTCPHQSRQIRIVLRPRADKTCHELPLWHSKTINTRIQIVANTFISYNFSYLHDSYVQPHEEKKNISTRMDILIVNHHRLAYNMGVKKKEAKIALKKIPISRSISEACSSSWTTNKGSSHSRGQVRTLLILLVWTKKRNVISRSIFIKVSFCNSSMSSCTNRQYIFINHKMWWMSCMYWS